MNDRIKLAEATNHCPEHFASWSEYSEAIEEHTGEVLNILLRLIPDPFTDANDCDALIRWLNEQGIIVKIEHYSSGISDVGFCSSDNGTWWSGDDWKQGVCELALMVID